jgi:predicted MFS family arabinose efflux permease
MEGSALAEPVLAPERPAPVISRAEWGLLLVLAAVQFNNVLDFVIIMPLSPQAMRELAIGPQRFGLLVSVYGFAACVASLLAAAVLDRFDRKKALLGLYAGFTVSTLLCGLAPRYEFLLAARVAAGAFGGVLAVAVLAIIGDVFADYRRGTATGVVMSAFSVASIVGVPAGLFAANRFGLGAPFTILAGLSAVTWVLAAWLLPPLRGHLGGERHPILAGLAVLTREPNHQRAFAFTTAVVMTSFTVVPYIAKYVVANVQRSEAELPYVYLVGGLCTLVSMNVIGPLTDRFGKLPSYRVLVVLTLLSVLVLTNLPPASLTVVLLTTTAFMGASSGRMVPAMTLITASAAPEVRGGFLSLNTAVQHAACGLASLLAGLLVGEAADKTLTGFPVVGVVAAAAAVVSLVLAGRLRSAEPPVSP